MCRNHAGGRNMCCFLFSKLLLFHFSGCGFIFLSLFFFVCCLLCKISRDGCTAVAVLLCVLKATNDTLKRLEPSEHSLPLVRARSSTAKTISPLSAISVCASSGLGLGGSLWYVKIKVVKIHTTISDDQKGFPIPLGYFSSVTHHPRSCM